MRKISVILTLLAAIFFGGIFYFYKTLQVKVDIQPEKTVWGEKNEITLKVDSNHNFPIGQVEVYLTQGSKKIELYKGPIENVETSLVIDAKKAQLKEGKAKIEAYLELPLEKKLLLERDIRFDLTPPQVSIVLKPHRLGIGEPGVVEVSVNEPTSQLYVEVGKYKFPLLPVAGSPNLYRTFIAAPLSLLKEPSDYFVVATDEAGNTSKVFLPIDIRAKKFRHVKIFLTEKQLKDIVYKFFPGATDLVEKFHIINHQFRQEDDQKITEICSLSTNELYAQGKFLQLPGSAPTAYFGDHRFYYYNGKQIDTSIHKGLDLAKYKHAPVVAANNGRVIYVGHLKIYGNVVLIDHGYGLVTLYGHLLDSTVKVGQVVKKGQIIGHTDTTGLALGDHLHFGTLIWGVATNPIYYFDPRYMDYYIYKYFKTNQ